MSVQSEIDRIQIGVIQSYSMVEIKGGTVPASTSDWKLDNLPQYIYRIPSGGGTPGPNVVYYSGGFPSTADENTIGVTNISFTNCVFSANEPSTYDDNTLWIKIWRSSNTPIPVSFSSPISSDLYIYPIGAYARNLGSWRQLPSEYVKCYQNGSWKMWRYYLFNEGDSCGNTYIRQGSGGSMTIGDGKMRLTGTARGGTTNTFNTNGYSRLCFDYNWISGSSDVNRTIGLNDVYDITLTDPKYYITLDYTVGSHYSYLDISNIVDGTYYLKFWFSVGVTIDIFRIWLEG